MRTIIASIGLALLGLAGAAERPNLLFIYLDDFGWRDTSYMGSDFFETPHLDRLAAAGMQFTHAYSAAANCAPARASLLSGQYTPRHEVFNVGVGPRGKAEHRKLLHIPGVATLPQEIETWAERLREAGYRTAAMGKWHLSGDPLPYGFDVNVGGTHAGGPPRGYYPPHPGAPGLQDAPEEEYLPDTLNRKAREFIRENRDRPWMLYLSHFAVHTPIQAKRELVEKYEAKPPGQLHHHVAMATMIEAVDQGVGRLLSELDELGLTERTAILFFSDNGGYGPATSMDPLRGYKGTYYEGGIRVPFFIHWPGRVEGGQVNATPITGVDLYPTLCEMAGISPPQGHILDGRSLVPLFTGEADPRDWAKRPLFWHFPAYLQSYARIDGQRDPLFRARPCSVVRKGDWKLIEYFEDGDFELFNLSTDVGEADNLAERRPDKWEELSELLRSWREDIGAPVPTEPNPEYDPEAERAAMAKALRRQAKGAR